MKDHQILMTGENVLAILEGRKTQTRRIIKPQPAISVDTAKCMNIKGSREWKYFQKISEAVIQGISDWIVCPYGKPGDRLWVKEAICGRLPETGQQKKELVHYKADGAKVMLHFADGDSSPVAWEYKNKTLPAMFMQKRFTRLWLEVKSVRAERLQEISWEDCRAEGCRPEFTKKVKNCGHPDCKGVHYGEKWAFRELWDSIYAKPKLCKHNPYTNEIEVCYVGYPWDEIRTAKTLPSGKKEYIVGNPMVWPIELERIET